MSDEATTEATDSPSLSITEAVDGVDSEVKFGVEDLGTDAIKPQPVQDAPEKGDVLAAPEADVTESETPEPANVLDDLFKETFPPAEPDVLDDIPDDGTSEDKPTRANDAIRTARERAQTAEQQNQTVMTNARARENEWVGYQQKAEGINSNLNQENAYLKGLVAQLQQGGAAAGPVENPDVVALKKELGWDGMTSDVQAKIDKAINPLREEMTRAQQRAEQARVVAQRKFKSDQYNLQADREAQAMLNGFDTDVQTKLSDQAAKLLLKASIGSDLKTGRQELHNFAVAYMHALYQSRLTKQRPKTEQAAKVPVPIPSNQSKSAARGNVVPKFADSKARGSDPLSEMLFGTGR